MAGAGADGAAFLNGNGSSGMAAAAAGADALGPKSDGMDDGGIATFREGFGASETGAAWGLGVNTGGADGGGVNVGAAGVGTAEMEPRAGV